ncbi:MAG: GtrA family protein [Gammaproteobacteria bacterium]|nr:GtrA family protein [Gammaproteobacteria bacterium]
MKTKLLNLLSSAHPMLRFSLVGGIGFIVDLTTLVLLHNYAALELQQARAFAFILAASSNWFLNRHLTFLPQHLSDRKSAEWLRFLVSAMLSAIPNLGLFYLLMQLLSNSWFSIIFAMSCGILLGLFSNYQLARHWVFRTQT